MENETILDIEEGEILENDFESPENLKNSETKFHFKEKSPESKIVFNKYFKLNEINSTETPDSLKQRFSDKILDENIIFCQKRSNPTNGEINYNTSFTLFDDYSSVSARNCHLVCNNIFDRSATYSLIKDSDIRFSYLDDVHNHKSEYVVPRIDGVISRKSYYSKEMTHREYEREWRKFEKKYCSYRYKTKKTSSDGKSKVKKKKFSELKGSSSDSSSEQFKVEERSRKKKNWVSNHRKKLKNSSHRHKREHYWRSGSVANLRDFDEVRKHLLEKLKREKEGEQGAENSSKPAYSKGSLTEPSKSQIKEISSCTDNKNKKTVSIDTESDEDLDLAQLRLMALASNKGKAFNGPGQNSSSFSHKFNNSANDNQLQSDSDFDRNELLLRAEALKTALLKKHQKRMKKSIEEKEIKILSSNSNNLVPSVESNLLNAGKNENQTSIIENLSSKSNLNSNSDGDASKKFLERKKLQESIPNNLSIGPKETIYNDIKTISGGRETDTLLLSNTSPQKKSFTNDYKVEENEKEEYPFDENILFVKNGADPEGSIEGEKPSEKKFILLDSVQRSANNPVLKSNNKLVAADVKSCISVPYTTRKRNVATAFPKTEIQRVIIHLGSEDSSEEDADAVENVELLKNQNASRRNILNKDDLNQKAKSWSNVSADSCFEDACKKVTLLLNQARRQIDGKLQRVKQSKANVLGMSEAIYKHLPPSQRIEYFRLKRKIAEREIERKKNKTMAPSEEKTPKSEKASAENSTCVRSEISSFNNSVQNLYSSAFFQPEKGTVHQKPNEQSRIELSPTTVLPAPSKVALKTQCHPAGVGDIVVKSTLDIRPNLFCVPYSHNLTTKLKFLLKNIKIEKLIQENYEKEIRKLKTQLSLVEKKKKEHQLKIKKLVEESVKTYNLIKNTSSVQAINATQSNNHGEKGLHDDFKSVECLKGKDHLKEEKQGEDDAILSKNQMIKAASESTDKNDAEVKEAQELGHNDFCTSKYFVRYDSPLGTISQNSNSGEKVNPNIIMCQYDMTGVCRDEECTYQHVKPT